jgi:serine/threonine-protein kinase RsbT
MADEVCVPITSDEDLVPARAEGRALARALGFSQTDATLIATAISEVARNIVVHVGRGEIRMSAIQEPHRHGLVVVAADKGPGIAEADAALERGYTSKRTLGLGLPGARRLMDEFEIESEVGKGTCVRMVKWRVRDELERLREKRGRSA